MVRNSSSLSDDNPGRRVRHSRNGCVSCKQRRLRCSEERPSCARCINNGRSCEYVLQLIWRDESVARGVKHGRGKGQELSFGDPTPREGSIEDADWQVAPYPRRYFLNTIVSDVEGGLVQPLNRNRIYERVFVPQLQYTPTIMELSTSDGMLFQYYQAQVCQSLTLVDDLSNCYRQIIMPLSISHSSVMESLMAVGALYLSLNTTASPTDYYAVALQHKQRALISLRRDIASSKSSSTNHILICILMLCLFDITDNCQISWSTHVSGAARLISTTPFNSCEPSLVSFVSKFFATRDVMGRSACGKRSKFHEVEWEHPQEIDKTVGCSSELLNIIASITDLSRQMTQTSYESLDLERDTVSIERRLVDLVQVLPGSLPVSTREGLVLTRTSSLIHGSARIYFYTTLRSALPSTPIIRMLVSSQMSILNSISVLQSAHLWSIFVTSLYAFDDNERIFFLGQFERLEKGSAVRASTHAARAIVQTVWKRRDLDEDLKDGMSDGMSDWAKLVRPMSEGLSLA